MRADLRNHSDIAIKVIFPSIGRVVISSFDSFPSPSPALSQSKLSVLCPASDLLYRGQ
jgi:hypothetical protein